MRTANYARLAATSLRLLKKYGGVLTLRDFTLPGESGTYDTTTGSMQQAYTDENRYGVLLPFAGGLTQHNGTLIQTGDKRLLLDTVGVVVPAPEDHVIKVIPNSNEVEEYKLVAVTEIKPADTVVLYDIHVRR